MPAVVLKVTVAVSSIDQPQFTGAVSFESSVLHNLVITPSTTPRNYRFFYLTQACKGLTQSKIWWIFISSKNIYLIFMKLGKHFVIHICIHLIDFFLSIWGHLTCIHLTTVNPLSPKSDQHQISPCNINALSIKKVTRIKNMITQDEFS